MEWEEFPQEAPAKLPVLVGTRHKLLTDSCKRLHLLNPVGTAGALGSAVQHWQGKYPRQRACCRLVAFGGADTAPKLVQRPAPLQYLSCGCARLRSCREGGC